MLTNNDLRQFAAVTEHNESWPERTLSEVSGYSFVRLSCLFINKPRFVLRNFRDLSSKAHLGIDS